MDKKLLFCLIFFAFQLVMFAQNSATLIKGVVKDSLNVVVGAHILNLQTNKGTFTSEKGVFEILA